MDFLNKTLFLNSEKDLKKIYDEEYSKLCKNELVLECLTKLSIQDIPNDLNEESMKMNALLTAVRICDFLDLGSNSGTLLDLEHFKLSKINLTYSEQKVIKEKVEELIKNKLKRRNFNSSASLEKKIEYEQNKFIELEKQNRELMLKLELLKKEEMDLMKTITSVFTGSDQKEIVKGLKQDAEILQLRIKKFINITEQNEYTKTKYSHKVLKEISNYLNELIEKKNNGNNEYFK